MDQDSPGRRFGALAATIAVMALVFLGWIRGVWFGPGATLWFSDLAQFAAPAVASWLAWKRSRAVKGPVANTWTMLSLALASWAMGQAIWSYYELVLGRPDPVGSASEIGFLLFPILGAMGLTSLAFQATTWPQRIRSLLDGAITASLLLFVGWTLFLHDAWLQTSADVTERLLLLWYPVMDVFIVALLLTSWSRVQRTGWLPMGLLAAGLITVGAADTAFLYLNYAGTYATGQIVDAGWFVGFLLMALATATPRRITVIPDPPKSNLFADFLPVASLLVAVAVASYALEEGSFQGGHFWLVAVYVTLLVARQALTVSENRVLWLHAREAVAALQEQQRIRSQMLNTLTHDLLSPLSAVRVQLKLSEMHVEDLTPQHRRALEIVMRNVEHVTRLGQDFKDVANLDSGNLPMRLESVNVAALAKDAVESFRETASDKGVVLNLQGHDTVTASADSGRLTQVLYNLISNALKFTPEGGSITVQATHGSGARVEVTDSGRGLEPDEIKRLFRPFSQVHDRSEVKERGTGLGLFISKGIIERHGGDVGVFSEGKGTGTTFWFTLPDQGPIR